MLFLTGLSQRQAYHHNLRAVFELVRLTGPMTIADMAGKSGLTVQTVGNLVTRLETDGFMMPLGRQRSPRGQPPMTYGVRDDALCSIGIHLERNCVDAAIVNLSGARVAEKTFALDVFDPTGVIDAMAEAVSGLLAQVDMPVAGVGLALPGPLSLEEGRALSVPNFDGWDDVPVGQMLKQRIGQKVYLENDATASALGELRHGIGRDCPDFFYIYFGTNLGGGIVSGGIVQHGATANAGEFGLLRVGDGTGRLVNEIASLQALRKRFPRIDNDMFDGLLEASDPDFMTWMDEAVAAMVSPVLAVENLLDPERIVLGGQLSRNVASQLVVRLSKAVSAARAPKSVVRSRLETADYSENTATLGAAALPIFAALSPEATFRQAASQVHVDEAVATPFWNEAHTVRPGNAHRYLDNKED